MSGKNTIEMQGPRETECTKTGCHHPVCIAAVARARVSKVDQLTIAVTEEWIDRGTLNTDALGKLADLAKIVR